MARVLRYWKWQVERKRRRKKPSISKLVYCIYFSWLISFHLLILCVLPDWALVTVTVRVPMTVTVTVLLAPNIVVCAMYMFQCMLGSTMFPWISHSYILGRAPFWLLIVHICTVQWEFIQCHVEWILIVLSFTTNHKAILISIWSSCHGQPSYNAVAFRLLLRYQNMKTEHVAKDNVITMLK